MLEIILAVNIGSTSFKYQAFNKELETLATGKIDRVNSDGGILYHKNLMNGIELYRDVGNCDFRRAVMFALDLMVSPEWGIISDLNQIMGVGFKTAHGGDLTGTVRIDSAVIDAMEEFTVIMPSHNKPYIEAIKLFQAVLPGTPLVAVFETGFHSDIPDYAKTYGVPYEWSQKYGIRRYGFHGASHRYVTERAAEITGRTINEMRLISCHLGGSSSVCAVLNGKSIDTSMGFSAQSGLMMSARSGDLDPFVIFHLAERHNISFSEIKETLSNRSGLLGVSGISSDLRDIQETLQSGNIRARLTLDVFTYETVKFIGAYAVVLGGLDVLAFTGGIGENNPWLRQQISKRLKLLNVNLDEEKNANICGEAIISNSSSSVSVLVVPANEEIIIARETLAVTS